MFKFVRLLCVSEGGWGRAMDQGIEAGKERAGTMNRKVTRRNGDKLLHLCVKLATEIASSSARSTHCKGRKHQEV